MVTRIATPLRKPPIVDAWFAWGLRAPRRALNVIVVIVVALASASGVCSAQVALSGVVLDSVTRAPLAQVEITANRGSASAATDANGRFSLSLPSGTHRLRLRRIGYALLTRTIVVVEGGNAPLEILMVAQAQVLDSVVTESSRNRSWPPGIDDRIRDGFGTFITDSVLRKFDHTTLSNALLSRSAAVRVRREQGRNIAMALRRGRASFNERGESPNCFLAVWVNGVLFWEPNAASGFRRPGQVRPSDSSFPPDLDQWMVAGLEAVEIYTAAQVPAQYRGGGAGCGVILIWYRQGVGATPDR